MSALPFEIYDWDFNWDDSSDWFDEHDEEPDTRRARSLMDAAGRFDTQPFADFRSASLAHRRTKKYPRKKGRRKSFCCPICHPAPHLTRLANRVEIRHHIQSRPWHDDEGAHLRHDELLEFSDDILKYELFGHGKSHFESTEVGEDGWVESEESFSRWGRRRIDEMRAVKENRIRQHSNENTALSLAPAATTLPTSPADVGAHNLLRNILAHVDRSAKSPRRSVCSKSAFIEGFAWFGEYTWQWHRNQSGFWELGYANENCNGELLRTNWTWYKCSCKDFSPDEPAPDEVQRCSLVEWVKGPLWDVMVKEEYGRLLRQAEGDGGDDVKSEAPDWEMMSGADAASEGWSVVESEESFALVE